MTKTTYPDGNSVTSQYDARNRVTEQEDQNGNVTKYSYDDLFGGTFRRNWEGDYHCTVSEVKAMLRDQTEDAMDMKILENMEMDVLNLEIHMLP